MDRSFGEHRGTAVDRPYIEDFLQRHRHDVTGDVLEIKNDTYTRRFGHRVRSAKVLDIDRGNLRADVVADLVRAGDIADASFDCFILTQTLQYVGDVAAALRHARRILRPGGVLLATLPALSQVTPSTVDYWRFLPAGAERLFSAAFPDETVEVTAYGNLAATVALLAGIPCEELGRRRLYPLDAQYPIVVAARAVRSAGGGPSATS